MKKAVTPVISIILLIILLLSIVAGTVYWIQTIQSGLQEQTSRETEITTTSNVPFSIITIICDSSTEKFTATIINNGIRSISGDTLFVITVSDINGFVLGNNLSAVKNSYAPMPPNTALVLEATIQNLDIEPETEYIIKINAGTSVQTVVCNSQ